MSPENTKEAPDWAGFLSSPRLLYWLLPALVLLCALGTLIPQGEAAAWYAQRFGAWAGPLQRFRLDDIYHSGLFTAALGLLALNLTLCTWRRQFHVRLRPDVLATHVGILVILAGGMVTAAWGRRGNLPLSVGQTKEEAEGTRSFRLPFAVKLEEFRIEYYDSGRHRLSVTSRRDGWSETAEVKPGETAVLRGGAVRLTVRDFFPDFVMGEGGPATRSQSPENPALRLELCDDKGTEKHWAFARFPGFHSDPKSRYGVAYEMAPGRIKQFRSEVAIVEGGWVALRREVEVNKPLRWKGYTLYQSGYDPENPDYSNLLVSRDPGVPLVYAGFLILTAGLGWTFARGLRRTPG